MYLYVLIERIHCCKLNVIKAMRFNCITCRSPSACDSRLANRRRWSVSDALENGQSRAVVIGYDAKLQDHFTLIIAVQLHRLPTLLRQENDIVVTGPSGDRLAQSVIRDRPLRFSAQLDVRFLRRDEGVHLAKRIHRQTHGDSRPNSRRFHTRVFFAIRLGRVHSRLL